MAIEFHRRAGFCSICADVIRLNFVENSRAMGYLPETIERLTREPAAQDLGIKPIKAETIKRHFVHQGTTDRWMPQTKSASPKKQVSASEVTSPHIVLAKEFVSTANDLPQVLEVPSLPIPVALPESEGSPKEQKSLDVASVVAQKAMEGLVDGSLRVTTQHGLQAQQMLDRREERRKDRELSIQLARVLSGAVKVPAHLIIDSTAKDVTPRELVESLQE